MCQNMHLTLVCTVFQGTLECTVNWDISRLKKCTPPEEENVTSADLGRTTRMFTERLFQREGRTQYSVWSSSVDVLMLNP